MLVEDRIDELIEGIKAEKDDWGSVNELFDALEQDVEQVNTLAAQIKDKIENYSHFSASGAMTDEQPLETIDHLESTIKEKTGLLNKYQLPELNLDQNELRNLLSPFDATFETLQNDFIDLSENKTNEMTSSVLNNSNEALDLISQSSIDFLDSISDRFSDMSSNIQAISESNINTTIDEQNSLSDGVSSIREELKEIFEESADKFNEQFTQIKEDFEKISSEIEESATNIEAGIELANEAMDSSSIGLKAAGNTLNIVTDVLNSVV